MVWKWIKKKKEEKAKKARIDAEKVEFVKRVKINKVLPQYPIPEKFLRSMSEASLIEIVTDTDIGEDAIKVAGENLASRNISEAGMKRLAEALEENIQSNFPILVDNSSMAIIKIFSADDKCTNELAIEALVSVLFGERKSTADAAGKVLFSTPQGRAAITITLE